MCEKEDDTSKTFTETFKEVYGASIDKELLFWRERMFKKIQKAKRVPESILVPLPFKKEKK